jgi:hypothetical protein
MHLFDLYDDVLLSIVGFVDNDSLLSFVQTCNEAYAFGMPRIVSSVHLSRDHRQVFDFCHFMLSDPSRWIPHLRTLTISAGAMLHVCCADHTFFPAVPFGFQLADVLTQAYNLQQVYLNGIEELISYVPRIGDALVECPRLSDVSFRGMRDLSREVLLRKEGLRYIDIDNAGDVLPLLKRSRSTLEEVLFMFPTNSTVHFHNVGQWPRVHSLKIGRGTGIQRAHLATSFPNLRDLSFWSDDYDPNTPETRAHNEQASECWPSLNYLGGDLLCLHMLALTCHVRELFVDTVLSPGLYYHGPELDTPYKYAEIFLELIRVTAPTVLFCAVGHDMLDDIFYKRFAQLTPRLTFFDVIINTYISRRSFLDQVVCAVPCLSSGITS